MSDGQVFIICLTISIVGFGLTWALAHTRIQFGWPENKAKCKHGDYEYVNKKERRCTMCGLLQKSRIVWDNYPND